MTQNPTILANITNGTLRVQSTSNTNMGGLLLNGASQSIGANLIFGDTTINSGLSTALIVLAIVLVAIPLVRTIRARRRGAAPPPAVAHP